MDLLMGRGDKLEQEDAGLMINQQLDRTIYISLFHQKHGSDRVEETNKQTTKQIHRQINK